MLVYIVPFFINSLSLKADLAIAKDCFDSLATSDDDIEVIIYNQGILPLASIQSFMKNYSFKYHILGDGENIGIPRARNCCLEYLWSNIPNADYIAEIHLDMIFTPNWHKPLIEYLKSSSEPCISPRILFYDSEDKEVGFKVTGADNIITFNGTLNEKITLLESYKEDKVIEGFVHPMIHKAEALKEIHPYDPKFLQGKQGFEDTSIILGYSVYQGTKYKWKPKINFNSCVYHKTLGQRLELKNFKADMEDNLNGLYAQYGAYGLLELSRILDNEFFNLLFNISKVFEIFKL